MKRNLKALGLALMAAFAMSAVVASAAQAEAQGFFTADAYPAVGTGHEEGGTENNYFQTTGPNGPKVHCSSVKYEATLSDKSTSLTVTPHYTSCEVTGLGQAFIDLNGCHYKFFAGTATATDVHGSVEIICPAGQSIEVTITSLCSVTVPAQKITPTKAGEITFTNATNGDVTVDVDITEKLTYKEDDLSIFCPNTNGHHTGDGSFVSQVLMTGFKDKENKAVTTTDHDGTVWNKTEYIDGEATNIDVGK